MKLKHSNKASDDTIYLNGSDLTTAYELNEIDFVWNIGNSNLHIINTKQYPLEVIKHFIAFKN